MPTTPDTNTRLIDEIQQGAKGGKDSKDNSALSILTRGCCPKMAEKAGKMLPPLIGNPKFVACTDDKDFIGKLEAKKWDIVFFAPGACRFSAKKMPIPGGIEETKGWGLEEYEAMVRRKQGSGVNIVKTAEEKQIVPLLIKALAEAR
jgi:hypothetical protein